MKKYSIFLHSGFRTGGSAIAFAFRRLDGFRLWFDPLSEALSEPLSAFDSNTSDWNSRHTINEQYFKEYIPLLKNDSISHYKKEFRFDYMGDNFGNELIEYLQGMISYGESTNQISVFKLETSEGRISFLKNEFPNSLHLGIIRDIQDQEKSWRNQFLEGNFGFYLAAKRILGESADTTDNSLNSIGNLSENELVETFRVYENMRRNYLVQCDAILDLTDVNSWRSSLEHLPKKITEKYKFWHMLSDIYLSLSRP